MTETNTINSILRNENLEEGASYELGKIDNDLVQAALRHYADHLDSIGTAVKRQPTSPQLSDSLRKHNAGYFFAQAQRARRLGDLIDISYVTTIHGLGEG